MKFVYKLFFGHFYWTFLILPKITKSCYTSIFHHLVIFRFQIWSKNGRYFWNGVFARKQLQSKQTKYHSDFCCQWELTSKLPLYRPRKYHYPGKHTKHKPFNAGLRRDLRDEIPWNTVQDVGSGWRGSRVSFEWRWWCRGYGWPGCKKTYKNN